MSSEYQNKKLKKIEKELESISKELYLSFLHSRNELKNYFDEKTLIEWALNGLNISKASQNTLKSTKYQDLRALIHAHSLSACAA